MSSPRKSFQTDLNDLNELKFRLYPRGLKFETANRCKNHAYTGRSCSTSSSSSAISVGFREVWDLKAGRLGRGRWDERVPSDNRFFRTSMEVGGSSCPKEDTTTLSVMWPELCWARFFLGGPHVFATPFFYHPKGSKWQNLHLFGRYKKQIKPIAWPRSSWTSCVSLKALDRRETSAKSVQEKILDMTWCDMIWYDMIWYDTSLFSEYRTE